MRFKAAILVEINKPLVIDEVENLPLEVGQVLVRHLKSGLCGAQLQEIAGIKGNAKFVPHLLGHEAVSIVEEIGIGVINVKPGDKVVCHWRTGKGIEAAFPSYIWNGKKISSGKVTTLSEYSVVSENRLTKVDSGEDDILCALMGCAITTAFGVINNESKIKLGESVLVVGVGGVGVYLIKGAELAGAGFICAVDVFDKDYLAGLAGANMFINSAQRDVKSVLGNRTFDVILDTSCSGGAFSVYSQMLSGNGRYILVGQPKQGSDLIIKDAYHLFNGNGQLIKATQGGKTNSNEDIPRYLKLYKNREIEPNFGVSHYYGLEHINEAISTLKSGFAGRIIIDI